MRKGRRALRVGIMVRRKAETKGLLLVIIMILLISLRPLKDQQ